MLGDSIGQRCGNDRLHSDRFRRHGALLDAACADVIEKQYAHLVTGDELIGAVRALHGDTDTVCIRVSREHQVRAGLLSKLEALLQCVEDLRVRIGAGSEVAVRVLLLRHDRDVVDTDVVQYAGDRNEAGTVQWGVHELEAGGRRDTRADLTCLDRLVECVLAVVLDELDETLIHALGEAHVLRTGEHVGLLDLLVDDVGGLIGHLTSVRTVGLIAVVLRRIVGCGHHDAGVAVIVTGGEGKGRYRHELIVDAHVDAVRCQHTGCVTCEVPALQTGIVADRNGLCSALGLHPVCHTLRRLANDPDIHPVGSCAECAAEASGSELECDGETLLDRVIIAFDILKLGF